MIRTFSISHRLGHQPSRARIDRAISGAHRGFGGHGRCAATRLAVTAYVARQANLTGSPAVHAFHGISAVPTMWTKWATRHLGTRST
jgi:hypothetical protein